MRVDRLIQRLRTNLLCFKIMHCTDVSQHRHGSVHSVSKFPKAAEVILHAADLALVSGQKAGMVDRAIGLYSTLVEAGLTKAQSL